MEIWLGVREDVIKEATFWTDGCGTTIAAGSMVTELAKGKTIREAMRITQKEVLEALGGLPEESQHCALLASDTLKEAVKDYGLQERTLEASLSKTLKLGPGVKEGNSKEG
jgi:nitrogen fixation NifU-like protein